MSTKDYKNQCRVIINEFVNEINLHKMLISNNKPIPFRDDIVTNRIRDKYKVPIELLKFRKDNGRIASDILTYERNKGSLDEVTDFGQSIIKRFLELKDKEPTEELINDIRKNKQLDEAIITADGFLINGNRRKMVMEKLLELFPGDEKYKYLEVVILPGPLDKEPLPTNIEIEKVENRCQLQRTGKAEYYNFDKALSIRRKLELGMTLEEQLLDDPNYAFLSKSDFKKELKNIEDNYLKPLECIDRYLGFLKRPGHYNTISEGKSDPEGRWQAFLDYYNIVFKKIKDDKQRISLGIQEDEIGKIENIAFRIIRQREIKGIDKKAHLIMRELPKLLSNPRAKKELFELNKIGFEIPLKDTFSENGDQIEEKTKDIIWSNINASEIIHHVRKAYEIWGQKKERDTPIELLNQAFDKLNHDNMIVSNIEHERISEAMKTCRDIQARANEIEHLLYEAKKTKDELPSKFKRN